MTASLLLSLSHLSKCYRLYTHPAARFKELLFGGRRHQEFWALRDVNFSLQRGTSLGILGENGAGKSTLLKLIAGVLTPTSGELNIHARVASIIELGMGFHPELSGRENLFIGSFLMGVHQKEIAARMPQIEEFSELGEFLDRPMKTYSTGMSRSISIVLPATSGMRLAFSLAISVEPELLIVDEALAVGDGYFQKKCIDRIRSFQEKGGSLLLCSHALYHVSLLCQEALWLRNGQVEAHGPAAQVVTAYETYLQSKEEQLPEQHWQELKSGGTIQEVRLEGGRSDESRMLMAQGTNLTVWVRWTSDSLDRLFHLGVAIDRVDNLTCFATSTLRDGLAPFTGQVDYLMTIHFPDLPLNNGSFRVIVFLLDEHGVHMYHQKSADQTLSITAEGKEWGIFSFPHSWKVGVERAQNRVAKEN